jgi:phosphopantothenoylcysteine decarboxylase/phosphopantothenate--cysteine ligase
VTLVSGPVSLPTPRGVTRIDVGTAREMHAAVMIRAAAADIFVAVAAVADYRPATAAEHKIKKEGGPPSVELVPNPDILADVAALPKPPFCVGFAAESRELEVYAQKKRATKKLPLIVGNLVQEGLGGALNRVVLFDDAGAHPMPLAEKDVVARGIVAHLVRLLPT